jgi:hypothetical protein
MDWTRWILVAARKKCKIGERTFQATIARVWSGRFWLIDVLWDLGRREQAREMINDALKYRNRYGLLAEDVHPLTGELWGNFLQTYPWPG